MRSLLLTVDARSAVTVRVAGKGITGTVEGAGSRDAYRARLLFLEKGEGIELNDTLVTSGHDKVFPPGIEVGYISSTESRQRGMYYELSIAPAVNFSNLDEVLVVLDTIDEPATLVANARKKYVVSGSSPERKNEKSPVRTPRLAELSQPPGVVPPSLVP